MVGMLNNYEGKYRPVIGNRGTSKSLNGFSLGQVQLGTRQMVGRLTDERGGLGRIGDIAIIN